VKRLALALLAALCLTGQTYTGVSVGSPPSGVTIDIVATAFAATAGEGGSLTCRAPCFVHFSATGTTIAGKTWQDADFSWDFGDPASYTIVTGGITRDLNEGFGFDAVHAYLPASYPGTCGGLAGRSHTATLRVTEESSGAKVASSSTVTICVQDPDAAWAGSKTTCYCDEATCTDDPGCPAGAANGGDVTANHNAAMACTGDQRRLFEGGVLFSGTGSSWNSSGGDCAISSYGSGQATLSYTGTSKFLDAGGSNGGVRVYNLKMQATSAAADTTFYGDGTGGERRVGFKNIVFDATNTFHGLYLSNPSFGNGQAQDVFFDQLDVPNLGTTSGNQKNCMFFTPLRFGLTGSTIVWPTVDVDLEHGVRIRQGDHYVIDANVLPIQHEGRAVITLRQNSAWFPDATQWGVVTRNAVLAVQGAPLSVAGTNNPDTPAVYDTVFDRNAISATGAILGANSGGMITCDNGAGQDIQRLSITRNYFNLTGTATSANSTRGVGCDVGDPDQVRFRNNAIVNTDTGRSGATYGAEFSTTDDGPACENNVLYDKSAVGASDVCRQFAEGSDSVKVASDPFDFTAGDPASGSAADFDELKITTASALEGVGVLTHFDEDVFGNAMPNGVTDIGVHEIAP
jgi:hypothetical protein